MEHQTIVARFFHGTPRTQVFKRANSVFWAMLFHNHGSVSGTSFVLPSYRRPMVPCSFTKVSCCQLDSQKTDWQYYTACSTKEDHPNANNNDLSNTHPMEHIGFNVHGSWIIKRPYFVILPWSQTNGRSSFLGQTGPLSVRQKPDYFAFC